VVNREPVISVRGEALLEVEPEIAIVNVTIQARDRDRQTVLSRLTSRNQQVTSVIKGYGEAVEKVESGPASIRPDIISKKAGERVSAYVGRASSQVTVRDFTVLGELVANLSDGDLVTVTGPSWVLRPDSPVYRDARLAAARDAQVRAREYAQAFGGEISGLIEAADVGLLSAPGFGTTSVVRVASTRAVGFSGGQSEVELDFEPAKQTVSAQVEARFALTVREN
jgi:uncharacterized protein YggE